MKGRKIALLDMDGTVADYNSAMTFELNKLKSEYEPDLVQHFMNNVDEEPGYIAARRRLISSIHGFWKSLPVIPLGLGIYNRLLWTGFEVHVLTKGPPKKPNAWSEKLEWCRTYLPEAKVIIAEDKSLVYGDLLVDDWPNYYTAWQEAHPDKLVIIPDQVWNVGKDTIHSIRLKTTDDLSMFRIYLNAYIVQLEKNL